MILEIAPWFVAAKVSSPRTLINTHRRSYLIERLMNGLDRSVTLIAAPAGFGKSTLLAQWRDTLREHGHCVAWVTIDEKDKSDTLIPYIAFAFERAGLKMCSTGLLSPSAQGEQTALSLSKLLNQIEKSPRRCALIFDEVERIPECEPAAVINELIKLVPENLHLVFACRQDPGLLLSKLALQGLLNRMGSEELRFTKGEIDILFDNLLSEKDCEYVIERTGGWPVALQLIRTVISDDENFHRQIRKFNGRSDQAVAYFSEQLFSSIPDDEWFFLLDTSVLDPVYPSAADYIRNARDSDTIISKLSYLYSLFTPLDVEDESYRLHPLLREYLYAKLGSEFPERFYELNRLAGEWMAQKGYVQSAIRYALGINEPELAATFFECIGGLRIFLNEGFSRFQGAVALLADKELDSFPRMMLARSLMAMRDGEPMRARELFNKAALASNGFSRDRAGGDHQALLIERYIVEMSFVGFGDSLSVLDLDGAARFILSHAKDDPALRGFVNLRLCLSKQQMGEFAVAERLGLQAIKELRKCDSIYGELWMRFHFGMMALAKGQTKQALSEYKLAAKQASTHFPTDAVLKTTTNVLLGELFWEVGDDDSAQRYLKNVPDHLHNLQAWFDISMAAYKSTAELLLSYQGVDACLTFLNEGIEHAANQELRRLEQFISAVRDSVLCCSGRVAGSPDEAEAISCEVKVGVDKKRKNITWRETECLALAKIRRAVSSGKFDVARKEVNLLEDMAVQTGNQRILVNGLVQRAILEHKAGNATVALQAFESALSKAISGHYIRPFMTEKQGAIELSEKMCAKTEAQCGGAEAYKFAQQLLDRLQNSGVAHQTTAPFLNHRELEVLRALSKGLSDKSIARVLDIGPHGVRYHLRNIFVKIGVHTRLQAVSKAQKLDLLSSD